jgi:S1-C subfamily serine protease
VEVIQTQTPISPGSSGGGLYDETGLLVGINTWTMGGMAAEGLHFAISAKELSALLRETGQTLE